MLIAPTYGPVTSIRAYQSKWWFGKNCG